MRNEVLRATFCDTEQDQRKDGNPTERNYSSTNASMAIIATFQSIGASWPSGFPVLSGLKQTMFRLSKAYFSRVPQDQRPG